MKTAQDLMTKNPIALQSDLAIPEAVKKMMSLHVSTAPVVDTDGKLMGQISEVNLLKAYILSSKPGNSSKKLKDFLKFFSKPTVLKIHDPIDKVVKSLMESPYHRVIICDGYGKLMGIISPKDLLRYLLGENSQAGTMMDELRILKDRLGILRDQLSSTKKELSSISSVIEKSDFMVHSVDRDGVILVANEKMHFILGYSPKELVGKSIQDIYALEFQDLAMQMLKEVVDGRDSMKVYSTYITKLGKPLRVEVITTAIRDPMGEFISTSSISREIDSDELLRALHKVSEN